MLPAPSVLAGRSARGSCPSKTSVRHPRGTDPAAPRTHAAVQMADGVVAVDAGAVVDYVDEERSSISHR